MSELKARFIDDTYFEYYKTGKHDLAQVYLKSEADKVIAEKDMAIVYAQALVLKDIKLIAHHKYKRCMAMAKWCEIGAQFQHNIVMQFDNPFYIKRAEWLEKWRNRWRKLAEQFKEG